jgi:hypothetical protein
MIKNRSLADRLNAVKAGKEIPKPIIENQNPLTGILVMNQEQLYEVPKFPSMRYMFLSSLLSFGEITIMSLLYGLGLMTLLSKDWNILGIFGVGLFVNQMFSLISRLKFFK